MRLLQLLAINMHLRLLRYYLMAWPHRRAIVAATCLAALVLGAGLAVAPDPANQ